MAETRVILSDLHFGDPACTLSRRGVCRGLRDFLRGLGPVRELVLAGDILDANVSSLTRAIEGSSGAAWPRHMGLRRWLAYTLEGGGFNPQAIVYVPGNHDHVVWNLLATQQAFIEPLARGERLAGDPLMEATFTRPFLQGIAPRSHASRLVVRYPDHEFEIGPRRYLVTHGHYLDRAQSLFANLEDLVEEEGDEARAARRFFIMTAQYQAVANAVSYMRGSRSLVDRVHKNVSRILDLAGKLRGRAIDAGMVAAMEMYIRYFRRTRVPDTFVFGHTHRAARALSTDFDAPRRHRVVDRPFEIVNAGSFVGQGSGHPAGTLVVISGRGGAELHAVDEDGDVTPVASQPS
jgi:UDP-2,3-diacylglucosamine pyrophosphatase LpxH